MILSIFDKNFWLAAVFKPLPVRIPHCQYIIITVLDLEFYEGRGVKRAMSKYPEEMHQLIIFFLLKKTPFLNHPYIGNFMSHYDHIPSFWVLLSKYLKNLCIHLNTCERRQKISGQKICKSWFENPQKINVNIL